MFATYPKFDQPILRQSSTGFKYFLELNNAGILHLSGPVDAEPTQPRKLLMVSEDATKAYRLGVTSGAIPLISLEEVPTEFGCFKELSVFSPNGREWDIEVNGVGALKITPIGIEWERLKAPILKDASGVPWRFEVRDGGVLDVVSDPSEDHLQDFILRDIDNTQAWEVTINTSGILSVSNDNVSLADTEYFNAELVSPMGQRWQLYIEGGIIKVDSIDDLINGRASWPLVMEQKSGVLYVVDNRFRRPSFGGRG